MSKFQSSLTRFVRAHDGFGQPIVVNFERQETYKTLPGGILTILLHGLTSIIIVVSLIEVFAMNDPSVISYDRPLSKDDRDDLTPLSFEDFSYYIAL